MSASKNKEYKEKLAKSEARKKRKVASMIESEQNQYLEEQRAKRKARNDKHKKDKQDNPKGYVLNEINCLLTDDFVKQKTNICKLNKFYS